MTRNNLLRRVALVAIAVVLAASSVGFAGVAMGASDAGVDNDTKTIVNGSAGGPYELEELRSNGRTYSSAPPSVRRYGNAGQLYVRHDRTSVFDFLLDPKDLRVYVEPGTQVSRDYVMLGGFRGWEAGSETITLKIAYWEPGTIDRQTENGDIVREDVAKNQIIDETSVELGSGYSETKVDLRDHYEDPTHVTMWVDGRQGDLQWTFTQKSSRASDAFPAGYRGSFVAQGLLMFILPAGAVAVALTYTGNRIINRAASGPGYDPLIYIGIQVFALILVSMFAWDRVREVFSAAPWLLGVLLGLNIAIVALELFGDRARKALVLQLFDVESSEDNGDGSGKLRFEGREIRLADTDEGTVVLKKGIRPFLARAFGAVPILEPMDGVAKTSIESTASPWSEMFLVNPYADSLLSHESEHWEIDVLGERDEDSGLPEWLPAVEWSRVAWAVPLLPAGWFLGSQLVASGLIGATVGAIVALFWISVPKATNSRIDFAPMHYDDVIKNVLQTNEGLEEKADREYYREKWHTAEGKNLAKRKSERESSEVSRFDAVVKGLEDEDDRDDADQGVATDGGGQR